MRVSFVWGERNCLINYGCIVASESVVLSCDFFPGDDKLVSTTLEGEVNVQSLKDDFNTIKHVTLESHHRTHIVYCCKTINNGGKDVDQFLIGTDNKLIE